MRNTGGPRGPRESRGAPPLAAPSRAPVAAERELAPPRANWWLRRTSWGWDQPAGAPLARRELARRSRLASWLILGLLVGVAILSPLGLQDLRARATLAVWAVGLLGAAALNRRGRVTLAGLVLVVLFSGGLLFANLESPIGLTMGELPNFDAYVIPVVIAATVLPRVSTFLVAGANTLLIVGNYLLQPHNANIARDAALYSSAAVQTVSLLVRPIALQVVLAVVAYLWVRGAEDAIARADRAEEVALLEHRERDRVFALEEGVRYMHQALSEWLAGDVRHRIPAMPVAILEQVRRDLNAFIERFGPTRQAPLQLRQLQEALHGLIAALDAWVQGYPAVWPGPSGTPVDRAVTLVRYAIQARVPSGAPSGGPVPGMGRRPGRPSGAPGPIPPDVPGWPESQLGGWPSRGPSDPANPWDVASPEMGPSDQSER
jgi:hypothetical protein